jgi:hypothetical protein
MITKIIEATNFDERGNWGKFMVMKFDSEWGYRSAVVEQTRLIDAVGWSRQHVWVLDLQTGEGACFRHGGRAEYDLNKHKVWVCPLFEPFLVWLYDQDISDLTKLPDKVHLENAPFDMYGYRREGVGDGSHGRSKAAASESTTSADADEGHHGDGIKAGGSGVGL